MQAGPLGVLEKFDIPIPTTGAGLIALAKTYAPVAAMIGEYDSILAKVKNIESIAGVELGKIKSLQSDILELTGKIQGGLIAAKDLKYTLEQLKDEWGDLDIGDIDIEDIPGLINN